MARLVWLIFVSVLWLASGCSRGMTPMEDSGLVFPDSTVSMDGGDAAMDTGIVRPDGMPPMDSSLPDGGPGRECVPEVCDNELDDDCDGLVDEDCACVPGEVSGCFSGAPTGRGVGVCRDGMMVCTGSFEFGTWGPCEGDVVDSEELCDVEGLDEDCDGASNEDCECFDGDPPLPCGTDVGECVAGTQRCVDGRRTACEGAVAPMVESCNGLDDDCDGSVDEGLTRTCGSDVGECAFGTETCADGAWGACMGGVAPDTEDCDGLDNDCDGDVDEMLTRACGSAVGACAAGMQSCVSGMWDVCTGATGPMAETCNDADDDCDGDTDEGLTRVCGTTDTGVCDFGTETCTGGTYGACMGEIAPMTEACDGILDEDCDGSVDEGCGCVAGATRPCGSSVGACMEGTETCGAGGAWGACMGDVGPVPEACNGVDDDCDGAVDEGCSCITGTTRPCGPTTGACTAGTQTCDASGAWGTCTGGTGPAPESCNDADDDCDGSVDEMLSQACGTDIGACMRGVQSCSAGAWGMCVGEVGPSMELCDGTVDENCDGSVDEGCLCTAGEMQPCGTDRGECEFGTETCDLSGAWGACTGGVGPTMEVCNGLDDDCDGPRDEGGVCMPPTVTCPGDETTPVGMPVTLSGMGMDPDGGSVTYAWTVVTAPVGSSATPSPPDAATTSFDPDAAGSYTLRLCVTDDEGDSACCTLTVTATSTCTPPTAPTLTTCPTSWDRRPVVQFDPVPSGVFYELYQDSAGAPYATVTMVGQNYHRPASELGTGSAPPGTSTTIYARACLDADPTCCATSGTVMTALIEECTTPIAPSASNLIFSEYVIDGDGACGGPDCEAGEAFEITNLSHCPVSLDNHHFSYCNGSCSTTRWMDFGPTEIVPPRGVYVAIRNQSGSTCSYPFFGPDDPSLFGLKISSLMMMGSNLSSGWFVNTGGPMSTLRIATGNFVDMTTGTTIDIISPYSTSASSCESIGFDAYGACGGVSAVSTPADVLSPNQLGRLWHPCDAVMSPVPAGCM